MTRPSTSAGSIAVLFVSFLALASGALAAAPPSAPAVAVVTDLAGKVDASSGGGRARGAAILDELSVGSRLSVADGGRVVLLWLESGAEFELVGPARAEIGPREPRSESGVPPKKRGVLGTGGNGDLRIRPEGAVQASVLMRAGESEVLLLSPVGTKVLDPRPAFEWKPLVGIQGARIEITDDSLRSVVQAPTTGSTFQLPESVRLAPGAAYSWEIEARDGAGRRVSGWAEFSVATEEERARVERLRPKEGAPFGDRVAFALLLEGLELFGEARLVWAELARERPGDPVFAARLAPGK